jgi:hypothetical protein
MVIYHFYVTKEKGKELKMMLKDRRRQVKIL